MSNTMFDAMFAAALTAGSGEAGFTPTETQLAAMNSGIDSEKVQQIETNKTNISKQQDTIANGGNGYAIINGIRVYVSSTAPTGDIPEGSLWFNTAVNNI